MKTDNGRRLYTIGQVSDLLDIPIRTIRYYEKIDLARPYQIDERTSYRYYSLEEIFILDIIRCLGRDLGMPLKKIREYINHQNEDFTLEQYLVEQAKDINSQIDALLARKSFLLNKLKAVAFRAYMKPGLPRLTMKEERKLFVRPAGFQDVEDVILSVRKVFRESENQYDRIAFLFRDFHSESVADDFEDLILGLDGPFKSARDEVTLPAGRYAEILYENHPDKRREAIRVLRDFVKRSGFKPEGGILFSGGLLYAIAARSDLYYFKIEVRLVDASEPVIVKNGSGEQ
ncbi:MAG: MerR family transcriptional regulator [Clostridiales Family XIII bacterium]|jgi:DNA-binding transcriptional MerR regulator|nr:MerR family transcriptional regulator [Clostridiales Family XIII bacterium]